MFDIVLIKSAPHDLGILIDNMPESLLKATLLEVESNTMAPTSIVVSTALSAIAMACQGAISVRRPHGSLMPVSLMFLTVADSGERKSTVEGLLMRSIRAFEKLKADECELKKVAWQIDIEVWDLQKKVMRRNIGKRMQAGEQFSELKEFLVSLEAEKPLRPKAFRIIYEDVTTESLFQGLSDNQPFAGLISSEGAGVLSGRAFKDLSKLNSIWSGDDIILDRISRPSVKLSKVRLTVSLMVQFAGFKSYMESRGENARGSGLLARFLVAYPVSTQGARIVSNFNYCWDALGRFHDRLSSLIEFSYKEPDDIFVSYLNVMRFDESAKKIWIDYYNAVEREICVGGCYEYAKDHASKLPDNVARIAALLQYFEFGPGAISSATMHTAIQLCTWYSSQFCELFVGPPQDESDAVLLYAWLIKNVSGRWIKKNDARRSGPFRLRSKNRLENAINVLVSQRKLKVDYDSVTGTTYLDLFKIF